MVTQEIANELAALWRQGKFQEAGEKYWADDVVSIEAMGDRSESRGKAAVRAKGEEWNNAFEINEVSVEGPYLNGDAFIVRFQISTTNRQSHEAASMDELALYCVKDGKITREQFFHRA